MRVALTGASGFVGKAVLRRLLADGHAVTALYRALPAEAVPGPRVVRGGLDSSDALFELVAGADVVLHVAGAVRARDAAGFHAVNARGTAAIADAAIAAGVQRFVHVSSLAARNPTISDYAASKRAAEDALEARRHALQSVILRPAAIYGPGDTATLPLLKALMSRVAVLPGRAHARFSLIHVEDVAEICVRALSSDASGVFEVDDLSGGHQWAELKSVVRDAFGRPSLAFHLPYGAALAAGAVASAAGRLTSSGFVFGLGKVREMYEPDWTVKGRNWPRENPISLLQGLPDTIRYHQQRGDLPLTAQSRSRQSANQAKAP